MENELEAYVDMLYDGLTGYVYAPVKRSDSWESKFFDFPTERSGLLAWLGSNKEGDVYLSPAVYSEQRATKDSFKTSQVIWVEFDGNERIDFATLPIPSAIVQTSFETHTHCYWKVPPSKKQAVESLNRRLTFFLEADSSGWDCTQLLRPPGTFNHKRQLPVKLVSFDNTFHEILSFGSAPNVPPPVGSIVLESDIRDVRSVLAEHELSSTIKKMILAETPVEPHRSSFLAKVANELAEEELPHLDIVSLLYRIDDRIQKFTARTDRLLRLSQIADYAIAKQVASTNIIVWTPEQILNKKERLEWILPGWLHHTGQLILSSAPGVGKTQLSFQLAYALSVGDPFLGIRSSTPMQHSIFYMSLEMDTTSLRYILERQTRAWTQVPKSLHIIDEEATFKKYESLIEDLSPSVVIIDSLTELFDETAQNANGEARRVMKWCRKIRRRYGLAVVLIHHNRKATEGNKKPKGLADLSGSFQFGKDSDTVAQLWEDHKGLELSLVKARFGPKEEFYIKRDKNLWFTRINKDTKESGDSTDASNRPIGPFQDTSRDGEHFNPGFGHGD